MFKNREGKFRSGWKIVAMIGVFYLAVLIFSIILGLVIGIFYVAKASLSGSEIDPQNIQTLANNNSLVTSLSLFSQEIITILVPIVAWKFIMKRPLANMGLTPFKKDPKDLLVGLFFGIVSISVVFLLIVASGNAAVETWIPHFSLNQLLYVFVFISVGFAEEIFTRGFIMTTLRQTKSVPVAVFFSALIFSLMHSLNAGIGLIPYINLILVGVLFSYMYLKSGNIWMCIGFHITWNYFQGYVFGFKVSGNDSTGIITTNYNTNNIFNGGAFGPEGGLFVTFIILLGLLFVKLYYKNSDFDFIASEPAVIDMVKIPAEVQIQNHDMEKPM